LTGYLVDTDVLIDYIARKPEAVGLLDSLSGGETAFSIITYIELVDGLMATMSQQDAVHVLDRLAENAPLLPLSTSVAARCARIRHDLRAAGGRVRTRALDLMIAATALEYGLTLVTRNERDDRDIPGLALYGTGTTAPEA
jgi:predicted nucleic acid-binding protein